jgi:hypothetical protein
MKAMLNAARPDSINMTRAEMEEMAKDEDFRRAVREALAKIQR